MARLLYGGRDSLLIGIASAVICCVVATLVALVAGFFGGVTDAILSRLLDVIWAFPIFLLAISLSIVLITHSGLRMSVRSTSALGSLWLPIFIIGASTSRMSPPGPRPGAVGGEQGVRGGRDRAGRVGLPADLLATCCPT